MREIHTRVARVTFLLIGVVLVLGVSLSTWAQSPSGNKGDYFGSQGAQTNPPAKDWTCGPGRPKPCYQHVDPPGGRRWFRDQPPPQKPSPLPWEQPAWGQPPTLPAPYAQLSYVPPTCIPLLDQDWREFERCLLIRVEEKPPRLPNLQERTLETWGRSNVSYNCYAYAVNRQHPTFWAGPRVSGQPRPGDIHISSPQDLFAFFKNHGWQEMPLDLAHPLQPGEERVVLYARNGTYYEHAAVWTSNGIFAKMGEYGVFRFSSLDQMKGPAFGEPAKMYRRE